MNEAIGGKIKQETLMMFNWKWKKNRTVEVVINAIINGVNVKFINILIVQKP